MEYTQEITLRPITEENWRKALRLTVKSNQTEFVPSVAVSLAKAYIKPGGDNHDPYGIYADEEIVGFFSLMYNPYSTKACYVGGFLVDAAYQRRGYGSLALEKYIEIVKERFPQCQAIYLTVHPENRAAAKFYEKFGFRKTGLVIDGEDAMGMALIRE